ncbi:MAG: DUF2155 domain-containing protein [Acetobacter sp.]|uniref:DUF2155 domain-containing protein n=1 Tax=Acetobacter sp. TaxID=440 RepID=UPI0039ED5EDF
MKGLHVVRGGRSRRVLAGLAVIAPLVAPVVAPLPGRGADLSGTGAAPGAVAPSLPVGNVPPDAPPADSSDDSAAAQSGAVSTGMSGGTPVAPPVAYPAQTWQGKTVAVVRVLDKLDAHVDVLSVTVGTPLRYKALDITARRCLLRPPTLSPDAAAWLEVQDTHPNGVAFKGWMLAAEPGVGVFESPVYDVRMVRCEGADTAPALPPLPKPVVPVSASSSTQSLPASGIPVQNVPAGGPAPVSAPVPSSQGVPPGVPAAQSVTRPSGGVPALPPPLPFSAPSRRAGDQGGSVPEAGGAY